MNWKSSLLGAVVVMIVGAATGVAIGGKTKTQTRTATVVRTVNVTTPATSTPDTDTTATTVNPGGPSEQSSTSTEATGSSSSGNSDEEYLAAYLESQGGAEALNHNSENASMDTEAAKRELKGQTYPHAVAFDLGARDEGQTASYQIPTPGFTQLTSDAVGLQTSSNASTTYHLTVYKNNDSSPHSVVLYEEEFSGPSTVHKMSFAIQGATDVLFVWTHKIREPEEGSTFILAEPVLTR